MWRRGISFQNKSYRKHPQWPLFVTRLQVLSKPRDTWLQCPSICYSFLEEISRYRKQQEALSADFQCQMGIDKYVRDLEIPRYRYHETTKTPLEDGSRNQPTLIMYWEVPHQVCRRDTVYKYPRRFGAKALAESFSLAASDKRAACRLSASLGWWLIVKWRMREAHVLFAIQPPKDRTWECWI